MTARLYYDLRGAQSVAHPERGIAKWVTNLAKALVASGRIPDMWLVVDHERPIPRFAEDLAPEANLVAPRDIPAPDGEQQVVFHLTSPFEFDYPVSKLIPPRLRSPGAYIVATLYDVIPLALPEAHDEWGLRLWSARIPVLDLADRIVAISEYSAQDAVDRIGLDPSRIRVIGTGVAPPIPLPDDRSPRAVPYVLYAGGTEHPRKNIPALIRAFSRLPASTRKAHELVVAGRMTVETERELRDEAAAAGVSAQTVFTGLVSDEQLGAFYAGAACFAYPSRYEGFGLPIAEAMSHGAPVVASRTTSCGELLATEEAGFDPDDDEDIAASLERVLTDQAFGNRLREEGRRIASKLTWEGVASRCVDAYEEVENSESRARSFALGHRTATFLSEAMPDPASPAAAFLQTAASAAELVRTEVATPAVFAMGAVGKLSPSRSAGNVGLMHGPLCILVDSPGSAGRAADLLSQQGGVAVLWELDLALGRSDGLGGSREVRRIAETGALIIVGSELDAARLSVALDGDPRMRSAVVPPPIAWNAGSRVMQHTLPFEAGMMLARGRRPTRGACSMRLVLASRPPWYGPWPGDELNRLAELATEINQASGRVRLLVLGASREQGRLDATSRARTGHAGDGFFVHQWPAFEEMCALLTAADAMVWLGEGSLSLADASERQAMLGQIPLVTGRRPRLAPEASVHVTTSAPGDWARAVRSVLDQPPRVPTPAELGRTPQDAARALVSLL